MCGQPVRPAMDAAGTGLWGDRAVASRRRGSITTNLQRLVCDDSALGLLIKISVNASGQQNSDVFGAVGIGPKYNSAIVEIYTIGTSGRHATNLGDDAMTFEFAVN